MSAHDAQSGQSFALMVVRERFRDSGWRACESARAFIDAEPNSVHIRSISRKRDRLIWGIVGAGLAAGALATSLAIALESSANYASGSRRSANSFWGSGCGESFECEWSDGQYMGLGFLIGGLAVGGLVLLNFATGYADLEDERERELRQVRLQLRRFGVDPAGQPTASLSLEGTW